MKQYLDIMQKILDEGIKKDDRTGVGTLSVFGTQARYDLSTGKFPLLTTKKLHLKSIIYELLWFLRGDTNVKWLQENGVHIWDEWADSNGDLGPIYSKQWRAWDNINLNEHQGAGMKWYDPKNKPIDQIAQTIEQIKSNPGSRRLVVSAWNVADIPSMALAPCHCLFQFYVRGEWLDLQLYQRSADWFLGVPFNIASYSLLLMMVAQVVGLKAGEFIHTTGDTHLYLNCVDQAKLQLTREPREWPVMKINPEIKSIDEFKYKDFELTGYNPWPHIKADVAV